MTVATDTAASGAVPGPAGRRPWALLRWLISYGTFAIPQAGGPIAFALLALPLTGNPRSGAAIVLAITVAQVVGAVPVVRLGQRHDAIRFLKLLVAFRTVAFGAVGLLATCGAPFGLLLVAAALAGLVTGAAFGCLRSVLNTLVDPSRMPRALGLAATLNEFTFVCAPVLASLLGAVDPVFAVLALAALGAVTVLLVPGTVGRQAARPPAVKGSLLTPPVLLWLGCTVANSAVVSSVEIGAVSLAVRYGFSPAQGVIFTVALCIASVAGGVWVSARNRPLSRPGIVACLATMTAGAAVAACGFPVPVTLVGLVAVGCVVAPLGTAYSLRLDALSPIHRRSEVFALARTANSLGIILTSTNLALFSLPVTQVTAAAAVCAAFAAVGLTPLRGSAVSARPRDTPP